MATRKTFHAVPYRSRGIRQDPVIQGVLEFDGKPFPIEAYADTGTDSALSLSPTLARIYGMVPEKRELDEIQEVLLADGTLKGAYLYKVAFTFGGRRFERLIPVIDESLRLKPREPSDSGESSNSGDEPLLGRGIMDDFYVSFEGKSKPKTLRFDE